MLADEWNALFRSLTETYEVIRSWPAEPSDPRALRCEASKHRTLAHLRACQEQWASVVDEFLARDTPSVTVLHPWRKFDQGDYAALPWEEHLAAFCEGRQKWLKWEGVDWNRGGKMNRKPETIGSLTNRLAQHEAYHMEMVDRGAVNGRQ